MVPSETSDYRIIESRSGHKVPVVNGYHLHSTYDPRYEAERFILEFDDQLRKNTNILLLGLGFAYHIQHLVSYYKKLELENYRIMVVEPNLQILNDVQKLDLLPFGNIVVYCGIEPPELFQNKEFLDFLVSKPLIIPHPASFNANIAFFKSLLSQRFSKHIEDTCKKTVSNEIKIYLEQFPLEEDLTTVLSQRISPKDKFDNPYDYFFLALKTIKEGEYGNFEKHIAH
jgi:hypothetical protein